MTTTNFNIRIDANLKTEASQILADYGLSPTQAIKMFLSQIVATREVPLSLSYQSQIPTPKLLKAIAEAENNDVTTHKNLEDFIKAFTHEGN